LSAVSDDEKKTQLRDHLYANYDSRGLEHGEALHGESFLRNVLLYEVLDPAWTDKWLSYVYGYTYGRTLLDDKTRVLVVIGEGIAAGHYTHLTHHMNTAIKMGVTPREILEVCLQSAPYVGLPAVRRSLSAFRASMADLGQLSFEEPPFEDFGTASVD
jgi:4-carboxymuconolactone decarboxylase